MRRFAALAASLVALFSLTGLRGGPDAASHPARAAQTVRVTIVFQCEGTRSVSPWIARLAPGDSIEWVLDPSSDITEFEIRKKRALQGWPFASAHPARGRPGAPAFGREMRRGASGRYAYDIVTRCPGPGGSMRPAVIDPDIIIDAGT